MLSIEDAIKKVEIKLNKFDSYWPDKPKILVIYEATIAKNWGWVFFYQSSDYLKTGDISSQLVGNAPYIFNKESGELIETGTDQPIEYYLNAYEKVLMCQ